MRSKQVLWKTGSEARKLPIILIPRCITFWYNDLAIHWMISQISAVDPYLIDKQHSDSYLTSEVLLVLFLLVLILLGSGVTLLLLRQHLKKVELDEPIGSHFGQHFRKTWRWKFRAGIFLLDTALAISIGSITLIR